MCTDCVQGVFVHFCLPSVERLKSFVFAPSSELFWK